MGERLPKGTRKYVSRILSEAGRSNDERKIAQAKSEAQNIRLSFHERLAQIREKKNDPNLNESERDKLNKEEAEVEIEEIFTNTEDKDKRVEVLSYKLDELEEKDPEVYKHLMEQRDSNGKTPVERIRDNTVKSQMPKKTA